MSELKKVATRAGFGEEILKLGKENPDILSLSDVVQCNMDVKQDRIEETYTKDGKTVSYQPPVYKYEYYYSMKIQVRSPWFDDMDFQLHSFAIEQENRAEMMEMERVGNEIIAALTGQAPRMQSGMPMNQGMNQGMSYGMNQGVNYGMNQGMNQGMNRGMNQGMQQDMNNMQQSGGTWRCQCGAENTGRFCEYCGSPRPF